MDKTIKIVLAAKLEGAQFLCTNCKKVFISEKHLKHHQNRRHSVIQERDFDAVRPTERIKNLVEFLAKKELAVQQYGSNSYGPGSRGSSHGINQMASARMSSSSLLEDATKASSVEAGQTEVIPSESPLKSPVSCLNQNKDRKYHDGMPRDVQTEASEALLPAKDNMYDRINDIVNPPCKNGVSRDGVSSINFTQLDIGDDEHARVLRKYVELAEESSFIESVPVRAGGLGPEIALPGRAARSKLLGLDSDIFSFHDTNDSWFIEHDSVGSSSELTNNDDQPAPAVSLPGDTASLHGSVMAELQRQLMDLGVDPESKGVHQKIFETARLTLHTRRARIAQESENFMSLLDEIRKSVNDKVSNKLEVSRVSIKSSKNGKEMAI